MPRAIEQRIAQYRSEVGQGRALWCTRMRGGWNCRFTGYAISSARTRFRAITPEGLSLMAATRVSAWGGRWKLLPGHQFPPIVDRYLAVSP